MRMCRSTSGPSRWGGSSPLFSLHLSPLLVLFLLLSAAALPTRLQVEANVPTFRYVTDQLGGGSAWSVPPFILKILGEHSHSEGFIIPVERIHSIIYIVHYDLTSTYWQGA